MMIRRFTALVLCLVCMAAFGFSAFAEEEAIPPSDAYEEFLNGERTVEVLTPEDNYVLPERGTYTLDELVDCLVENFSEYGMASSYDVQYAIFGEEGIDLLALSIVDSEYDAYNWIGILSYTDDRLVMYYDAYFGYRSFLNIYNDGYIYAGGSDGAGASSAKYLRVLEDGTTETVRIIADLYSSWCEGAVYYVHLLDDSADRNALPRLTDQSVLEMEFVEIPGQGIYFTVDGYSQQAAVRKEEESFIEALIGLGAEQVTAEEMAELLDFVPDEDEMIYWWGWDTVDAKNQE